MYHAFFTTKKRDKILTFSHRISPILLITCPTPHIFLRTRNALKYYQLKTFTDPLDFINLVNTKCNNKENQCKQTKVLFIIRHCTCNIYNSLVYITVLKLNRDGSCRF